MEIIYLDELIFINFITDYLICLVTARICALPLRRLRFAFAAALGAVYAACCCLPELWYLQGGGVKLGVGLLLAALCFAGERHFLRSAGVFFAVSAAFGGAVQAVSGGYINSKTLIVSFFVLYFLFSLIFRARTELCDKKLCSVKLCFSDRSLEFKALEDTGNSLRDALTGYKVMLISKQLAEKLIPSPPGLFSADAVTTLEKANADSALHGRFRLISCRTAAGNTMLPLFRPDRLIIDGQDTGEILAAVSPTADGEGFEAII